MAVVRVYLEAEGFRNLLLWKRVEERGIEGSGADGRVEEMHWLLRGKESSGMSQNIAGKGCRSCKLAQAIPLGLCLSAVKFDLKGESLFLNYVL